MKIEGISGLKTGAKIWINGSEYLVKEVIQEGNVKGLELNDKSKRSYFLRIGCDGRFWFYKMELDPISLMPIFSDEDAIEVVSIEF